MVSDRYHCRCATVPRVIVQDAQRQRPLPLATRRDHLQRAVMEVEVPQCADVLGLVTADLTPLAPLGRQQFSRDVSSASDGACAPAPAPPCTAAPWSRTGADRASIGLHQRLQVVVVQLIGPVRVIVVLVRQTFDEVRLQGHLPAIFPHGASQDAHRIVPLLASAVEPTFNRLGRETDLAPGHRMRPRLGSQGLQGGLQFSRAGGALNSAPTTEKRKRAHKAEVD